MIKQRKRELKIFLPPLLHHFGQSPSVFLFGSSSSLTNKSMDLVKARSAGAGVVSRNAFALRADVGGDPGGSKLLSEKVLDLHGVFLSGDGDGQGERVVGDGVGPQVHLDVVGIFG